LNPEIKWLILKVHGDLFFMMNLVFDVYVIWWWFMF
jgi:hypothetical protein